MTRTYALQRLLSIEPCTEPELRDICGWPMAELRAALESLRAAGAITWHNCGRGMRLWKVVTPC